VEAGQRIGLTRNWTLTPQAQLVYSAVSFDRFTDPFGANVSLDRGDSLKSRLGISADYGNAWKDATGKTVRTLVYGIANVSYEFRGDTQVSVSGVKVASAVDRLQGGVGLGGSYSWREGKYTVYGEGTINTGLAISVTATCSRVRSASGRHVGSIRDLKADVAPKVRHISVANSAGCSKAAKCPPLSTSFQ